MFVIGEVVLSVFLELLGGKLLDSALNFVTDHKQLHPQMKQWQSILLDIQAVLGDAAEKQIKNEGVKKWLEDLQDLAYNLDDILDQFSYEQLRLKLQKTQGQASTSKVFLQGLYLALVDIRPLGSHIAVYKNSIVNGRIPQCQLPDIHIFYFSKYGCLPILYNLTTQRSSLGLSDILSQALTSKGKQPKLQPTSVLDGVVEYVGRHKEKTDLIELLNGNNSNGVSVLSIVGMGGMGKTTLAHLVYNDATINESFDLFKEIGEKIIRRCNGLPLAVKAIGSLLRIVKYHGEWERIYESEIWNLPEEQCGIIPALRLSYHHLPSYLKRCFAYCSILPKDNEFEEEEMILLWRAEEGDRQQKFSNRTRHSSYIAGVYDTVKKFEAFDQVKSLRTFLPSQLSRDRKLYLTNVVLVDFLPKLGYLRVLSLSGYAITELPDVFHASKFTSKMENLVNLHYLDIRGAHSIKRIPFRIDKLTNLQRLTDFIIGEGDGCHIRDLKYLSNLKGDFRLSGLENVNGKDAGKPNPSFKNMLSLELHDCKNCESLPSIGRLLLLKDLSISGLDQVHKIGAELFGENQSNAFAALESLRFGNMLNWEEGPMLPAILQSLQKLEIFECKRLLVSISSFPLLCELRVNGCELVDEGSLSVQRVTSLKYVSRSYISKFNISAERIMLRSANSETFNIYGWKELGSLSQNGLSIVGHRFITFRNCPQLVSLETEEERFQLDKIPGVESLDIRACERHNRLPKVLHAFPLITRIELEECPGLVCFAESNFPPALKELRIVSCVNLLYLVEEKENNNKSMSSSTCLLERLVMSSSTCLLERLEIRDCPSLIWLSSRADICNRLQHLDISNCSEFGSLFLNAKLPVMLKHLEIWFCPVLECIAQDFLETTDLESVTIRGAEKLKSLQRGFDKLSHLQEIRLATCPNLVPFEESGLPTTNLRVLMIFDCENFGAFPSASTTSPPFEN
ncbi:putative disease resistance RPP13-like protein 1 [Gossypium arboreum]|uniref:putative disease resistance RPP13-like protein 1 n=1 Tax=Gossypium arboreum TaxID=29729 RepID=UPI0022F1813D|nr:putative disease resistance RPP13-like protein 1 [Gossypium arboreum]